jgi:hypothetical protein
LIKRLAVTIHHLKSSQEWDKKRSLSMSCHFNNPNWMKP